MGFNGSAPHDLVIMEYYQNAGATLSGNHEWRPDAWHREEFDESDRARRAREVVEEWFYNTKAACAYAGHILDTAGPAVGYRPELWPVVAMARWLDRVFYSRGKVVFPRGEWTAIQLAADRMPRAAFCCMDFRAVADKVRESGIPPKPLA